MDPDLSEFEEKPRHRECKVREILAKLDEERKKKLVAALNGSFSHTKIANVVTEWGFPVSDNTVGTHRKKRCSCD